jgi:hypothetical protein
MKGKSMKKKVLSKKKVRKLLARNRTHVLNSIQEGEEALRLAKHFTTLDEVAGKKKGKK